MSVVSDVSCGAVSCRGRSPVGTASPAPDLIPYVRTDEVFNLSPEEPERGRQETNICEAPAPQLLQKTQRQQEILRGLAQLRQVRLTWTLPLFLILRI